MTIRTTRAGPATTLALVGEVSVGLARNNMGQVKASGIPS